jgi:hypothetical protein
MIAADKAIGNKAKIVLAAVALSKQIDRDSRVIIFASKRSIVYFLLKQCHRRSSAIAREDK